MHPAAPYALCRDCHCLAARRQARAITRIYEARLRPYGLRATQFSVLAALAVKGPTPLTAMALTLGVERTTLTRVGALLQRNGWVATAPGGDARQRPLSLTPAGRRKLDAALPAWQSAQNEVGQRLAAPIRQMKPAVKGTGS